LREPIAAELARDEHRHRDESRTSKRGNPSHDRKRSAQLQGDARDQTDQRRVIDVAPAEVATAVEEVELVAEVTVAIAREEMNEQLEQRDGCDGERCGGAAIPAREGFRLCDCGQATPLAAFSRS
jgi:hypothetical protein